MKKYLDFIEDDSPGKKTRIVQIVSTSRRETLGFIKWHGAWRQYTFMPMCETIWNVGCMTEVMGFINIMMIEHRREKRRQRDSC